MSILGGLEVAYWLVFEVKKPMGSFHIIDGEKVSIRYRSQIKSCARCHKSETRCPGKAVASQCSDDRVLLSRNMQENWQQVGYAPDINTDGDVDEDEVTDMNIQIGSRTHVREGPDLTLRYTAVMINGFQTSTSVEDIHQILVAQGLPSQVSNTDIMRHENPERFLLRSLVLMIACC